MRAALYAGAVRDLLRLVGSDVLPSFFFPFRINFFFLVGRSRSTARGEVEWAVGVGKGWDQTRKLEQGSSRIEADATRNILYVACYSSPVRFHVALFLRLGF